MDRRTLLMVVLVTALTGIGGAAFFYFGGATAALGGAAGLEDGLEAEPITVRGSAEAALWDSEEPDATGGIVALSSAGSAESPDGEEVTAGTIRRVVATRIASIRGCYERELRSDPALAGKVVIAVTVKEAGDVQTEVRSNSLERTGVAPCLQSTIARLRFPAPGAGREVSAVLPFVFEPGA